MRTKHTAGTTMPPSAATGVRSASSPLTTGSAPCTTSSTSSAPRPSTSTPAQDRLHLGVFDVTTDDRSAVIAMLEQWTDAARKMCAGNEVGT